MEITIKFDAKTLKAIESLKEVIENQTNVVMAVNNTVTKIKDAAEGVNWVEPAPVIEESKKTIAPAPAPAVEPVAPAKVEPVKAPEPTKPEPAPAPAPVEPTPQPAPVESKAEVMSHAKLQAEIRGILEAKDLSDPKKSADKSNFVLSIKGLLTKRGISKVDELKDGEREAFLEEVKAL